MTEATEPATAGQAQLHHIRGDRVALNVESHGDRDMPVWGDPFTLTREGRFRDGAEARIAAIVRYLESIQRREAQ